MSPFSLRCSFALIVTRGVLRKDVVVAARILYFGSALFACVYIWKGPWENEAVAIEEGSLCPLRPTGTWLLPARLRVGSQILLPQAFGVCGFDFRRGTPPPDEFIRIPQGTTRLSLLDDFGPVRYLSKLHNVLLTVLHRNLRVT